MGIDYSLFKFSKNNLSKVKRKKDVTSSNRSKIREIYHYQCALCKKKGTQIHHIIYKSEDRSKIDDLDNLILLCSYCHKKVHANKSYWQPKLLKIRKEIGGKRNERIS